MILGTDLRILNYHRPMTLGPENRTVTPRLNTYPMSFDPEDRRLDLHLANISWITLLNPDLHHLTPTPGTITRQDIDRIRNRGPQFGTVILGTETSPLLHLVRLEPRLTHLHPLLLGLLQSYTKARPSR
ncbi:UNVERIFIED_CONTAM: hypothetical protein K2H54_048944 [Gekko kuhli]